MHSKASQQLTNMLYELGLMINHRWWRVFSMWFTSSPWVIISYRLERFLYLFLGRPYGLARIILLPLLFITQPWRGNCEIHYRADIGKGLKILHPSLGIVVNGNTLAGDHLTLTGGNCIGGRESLSQGDIRLGDHVSLGANAVVLGPVTIGNNVKIGAGAVVIHDASDNAVLVGVPAKSLPVSEIKSI